MNSVTVSMIEYIVMFLLIVGVIQLLKLRGIFNDSHQPVFDRLVTEFALPAIVFGLLTTTTLRAEWVLPVLIVNGAVLVSMLVAWAACRTLKFSSGTTGAIVILSAWGSTYTVGAPVIAAVYGSLSEEVALSQVLGVFGFALPFFTIGIMVAGYFGIHERGEQFSLVPFLKTFFCSPIFLAFWLGLIVSLLFTVLHLPGADIYYDIFSDFFIVIQHAINLLVWIAIGLLLRPIRLRTLLPLLALVAVIHLVILPALVFSGGYVTGLPIMERNVAVILTAMPSGAIAGVVAERYGCDGKLAAAIIVCTYLISLVTLPLTVATGI
ncbi:MAG: AEC family transporter [Methanoregula sp.]|nr:AEC family transporter [Methanoregula sp.]